MDLNSIIKDYPWLILIPAYVFNTFVVSWLGGWRRLASEYRCDDDFDGTVKKFQNGYVGFIRYGRSLWIGTSAKGLYLKTGPLFFFRLFHPPLLIPWSAVSKISDKNFLWQRNLKIEIKEPKASLTIPRSSIEDESRYWIHLIDRPPIQK